MIPGPDAHSFAGKKTAPVLKYAIHSSASFYSLDVF